MTPTFKHTLAALPARQLTLLAFGAVAIALALAWSAGIRAPLATLRQQQLRLAALAARPAPSPLPAPAAAPLADPVPAAAPTPLDLIAAVSVAARASGVAVASAVPGPERSVDGLRQQTLDIEASGSYPALLAWIAAIEAGQPAVGLLQLALRPAPDEPRRLVHMRLGIYAPEAKP